MPNPNPTPRPKGTMYSNSKPRTNGGISGSGGKSVSKDYKETGTQKSWMDKFKNFLDEASSYPEYKPTAKQELERKKILKKYLAENKAK